MAKASELISVAQEEIGYLEKATNSNLESKTANAGNKNFTKYANDIDKNYIAFYNGKKNGFPWCDVFVDWCFITAFGVSKAKELICQPDNSLGAGCYYSMRYYKQKNQFHSTNPQIGDQIFFKDTSGDIAHTGIVYKVDGIYVYTIEGNTSSEDGVIANGGCVRDKKYPLTYNLIYGYGRPQYDVDIIEAPISTPIPVPNATPIVNAIQGNSNIRACQQWLNSNYGSALVVDGIYGPKTKVALIKAFQKFLNSAYRANLVVDGDFGAKTKNAAAKCTITRNARGPAVYILQGILYGRGYNPNGFDGIFGNGCFTASKTFQGDHSLAVDGIVGKNTWYSLFH